MKATKLSAKSASTKATPSRTTTKKATNKTTTDKKIAGKKGAAKKTGKKRSSPGMFSRAAHAVGEVLLGAATGAVVGAVTGAVEAGGKEMGIPKASATTDGSQKDIAEEPSEKKPKKRK